MTTHVCRRYSNVMLLPVLRSVTFTITNATKESRPKAGVVRPRYDMHSAVFQRRPPVWSPPSPELLLIGPPRSSKNTPNIPGLAHIVHPGIGTRQSFPSSSRISPHSAFGLVFSRFAPGHFTFPKTTLLSFFRRSRLPTDLYTFFNSSIVPVHSLCGR